MSVYWYKCWVLTFTPRLNAPNTNEFAAASAHLVVAIDASRLLAVIAFWICLLSVQLLLLAQPPLRSFADLSFRKTCLRGQPFQFCPALLAEGAAAAIRAVLVVQFFAGADVRLAEVVGRLLNQFWQWNFLVIVHVPFHGFRPSVLIIAYPIRLHFREATPSKFQEIFAEFLQ